MAGPRIGPTAAADPCRRVRFSSRGRIFAFDGRAGRALSHRPSRAIAACGVCCPARAWQRFVVARGYRLGLYVRRMPYDVVYGGLAAAIGLLIWMYLTAVVVLLGIRLQCRASRDANSAIAARPACSVR